MRKILSLLVISILLFSCHPDTDVKKATNSDTISTPVTDTNKSAVNQPPLDSVQIINIKDYEIPTEEALEMIKWYKGCTAGVRHDNTTIIILNKVEDKIKSENPKAEIEWVDARFRDKDDEALYCKINGGDSTGGKCLVKNYKAKILKVKGPKGPTYYLVHRLCPPPYGCDTSRMTTYPNKPSLPIVKKHK